MSTRKLYGRSALFSPVKSAISVLGYRTNRGLNKTGLERELGRVLGFTEAEARTLIDTLETANLRQIVAEGAASIDEYVDYFINTFSRLQDKPLNTSKVSELSRGSYGAVYNLKEAPDLVIKEQIDFIRPTDKRDNKALRIRDFFVEVLIQVILSNDLEFAKYVPKIYSVWRSGTNKAYTEMARISSTSVFDEISNIIRDSGNAPNSITFATWAPLIYDLARVMDKMYDRYKFVHLDFKLGNVGKRVDDATGDTIVQIFDFGSSCITFSGKSYRSKAWMRGIISDVGRSCNQAADFGLFLTNLHAYFGKYLDDDMKKLLEATLMKNVRKRSAYNIIRRAAAREHIQKKGRRPRTLNNLSTENIHFAAYNYDDTLYRGYEDHILPKSVMKAIDEIRGSTQSGGRRTRGKRRTRR